MLRLFSFLILFCGTTSASAQNLKLLIASASFRERPRHPKIYFYEHDGVEKGKIVGSIDAINQRSDYRPSLSHDGRFCVFASELENQTGRISFWDRKEKKLIDLPKLNDSPNSQLSPALSGDGSRLIALVSDRKGGKGGRDIYLFDRKEGKYLDLPGLNSTAHEQTPVLSPGGRFLVFVSERIKGEGERDVYLYDRKTGKVLPTPGLNSKAEDFDPCVIVLAGKE